MFLDDKLKIKKAVFGFFVLTILIQAIMSYILRDVDMIKFLKLQLTFDKNEFVKIISSFDKNGFEEYKRHFYADFLYLISYSFLMFSLVSLFYDKIKTRLFLIIPFIIALFDVIENLFHIYFFKMNYKVSSLFFVLSGIFSLLKWLLVLFEIIFISYLFLSKR